MIAVSNEHNFTLEEKTAWVLLHLVGGTVLERNLPRELRAWHLRKDGGEKESSPVDTDRDRCLEKLQKWFTDSPRGPIILCPEFAASPGTACELNGGFSFLAPPKSFSVPLIHKTETS